MSKNYWRRRAVTDELHQTRHHLLVDLRSQKAKKRINRVMGGLSRGEETHRKRQHGDTDVLLLSSSEPLIMMTLQFSQQMTGTSCHALYYCIYYGVARAIIYHSILNRSII